MADDAADALPPGSTPPAPAPLRPLPRPPKLPRQHLCASGQLEEKGRALVFDVSHFREPARAFVLRFEGRVVAYLNRCVHVPTELDWQPGVFLDSGREFILCSIHGAAYDPRNGRCAGGPCGQGKLLRIEAVEDAGQVYWEPTADTRPLPPGQAPAPGP
ncbi:MAG TPA: Rieske 2Fe-2S domain-containing protein [Caldimonas sp.]|jgi:nitrite reductase/ring-hydroxylating ferredoxin subunit|nr:Rieske 2Fe-2S domain-containing protein [Caldimonas sp.]HEX2542260.1 Rieske 2Fe-2S domain-containing protein [Caldimonas sp.]